MADETVRIVVEGEDKASSVFNTVGGAIGGMGKIAGGLLAGGLGIATGGVLALSAAAYGFIDSATEGQNVAAQMDAVLKSTGGAAGMTKDELLSLATSLQTTTKFEDEATAAAENILLTFTGIGKEVFPDVTKTALDMATALGGSATEKAMMLGKAFNDPIKGMSALQKSGVVFTDEQKKMVTQLEKSGDTIGAQKILLAELQKEFGGSAEAAGNTFSGKLAILKNTLGDVGETIGGALLPVASQFLDTVIKPMIPQIQKLADQFVQWIQGPDVAAFFKGISDAIATVDWTGLITGIATIADSFGKFVSGDYAGAFDLISQGVQKIFQSFGASQGTLDAISTGIQTFFNFVRDNWPAIQGALEGIGIALAAAGIVSIIAGIIAAFNPVTLAIMAIIAIAALLGAAWNTDWGGIQEKTQAVIDFLTPFVQGFLDGIQAFWKANGEQIMSTVKKLWDTIFTTTVQVVGWLITNISNFLTTIRTWWAAHGDEVKAIVKTLWDGLQSIIQGFINFVKPLIKAFQDVQKGDWFAFGEDIRKAWDTAWENLKKIVVTAKDALITLIKDLIAKIIDVFTKTNWEDVGTNLMNGISNGIHNMVGKLVEMAKSVANAAVNAIKGVFHQSSPSKVGIDIGENFGGSVGMGMVNSIPLVTEAASAVASSAITTTRSTVNQFYLSGYEYQNKGNMVGDVKTLELLYGR